jgi:NADH-quinone oxidoreductase subunit C
MSEERNENGNKPEPKSMAASPAPAEEKSVEPGEFGAALNRAGLPVTHLGRVAVGNEMLQVSPAHLLGVAAFLRDHCELDLLLSCAGVDWKDRLESVYHLYSTRRHQYVALKVAADAGRSPSLTPVWSAADWHERESYDLLGIHYEGHPNLSRILMPNDWLGHPLRKDYKVDDPRLVWNER